MKLLVMQSTPVPSYIVLPRLKYPPQNPILSLYSYFKVKDQLQTPHTATGKNIIFK
jgi:hypothetical protein